MIEELEENSNKSLADNEIASLMRTLASKNYKENSSFPKKIIEPFKPTSLFEIAKKNVSKNESNVSKEKNDIDLKSDSTQQDKEIIENNDNQLIEDTYKENKLINPEKEIKNDVQQRELDQTDANSEKTQEINEQVEANNNTDSLEKDPVVNVGVPIKENLYTKDDLNNEYQKGILEGVQQEQKKNNEGRANSIKDFDNLIKKINEKTFIDTNALEKHIKQEIIKIASERVGSLIDEMPREFLEKIKSLSNTIRKKSEKKILKLNSDDLKSVEKIIQDETLLKQFVFHADKSLSRGDYIIEIGEISLEDKFKDRYDINEESSKYFEIDNTENADNEISLIKQNSQETVQKNAAFDTQNTLKKELIDDPLFNQEQNVTEIELNDDSDNASNSSEQEIIDDDLQEKQKNAESNKINQINDEVNDKSENQNIDEFIEMDNEINDKSENQNIDEFIEMDNEINNKSENQNIDEFIKIDPEITSNNKNKK